MILAPTDQLPSISDAAPTARLSIWMEILLVAIIAAAGMALLAIWLGQDVNFDLRNYHYYTGYMLLHSRADWDIMPSQTQTFLNPLVQIPYYIFASATPPKATAALMGILASGNIVALYALSRRVILTDSNNRSLLLAAACTLTGILSPIFIGETGTSFSDSPISVFVLLALLPLVGPTKATDGLRPAADYIMSGIFLGAAFGLKSTMAVFILGTIVAIIADWRGLSRLIRNLWWLAVGGTAGFAATGGYWMYYLFSRYHTPTFPFYNNVFHSEWWTNSSCADDHFVPDSLVTAIGYPCKWFLGMNPTAEVPFRDARYVILGVLFLLVVAKFAARLLHTWQAANDGPSETPNVSTRDGRFLLTFFATSFIIWIRAFSIHRYVIPLELISGLVLFILCTSLFRSSRERVGAFLVASVFITLWLVPSRLERVPNWQTHFYHVDLPKQARVPNTLYFMTGHNHPYSYIIPSFPADDRFIRMTGAVVDAPGTPFGKRVQSILDHQTGPIRLVCPMPFDPTELDKITQFHLRPQLNEGVVIVATNESFFSCPLVPIAANAATSQPAVQVR